jgi:hypothetical protein
MSQPGVSYLGTGTGWGLMCGPRLFTRLRDVRVSDGDGELSVHFAGHELPHRIGCLLKWVLAVDAGRHRADFDELGQPFQVRVILFGDENGEPLRNERREHQGSDLPAHSGQLAAFLSADDDKGASCAQRSTDQPTG